jgi:hypothetical protein
MVPSGHAGARRVRIGAMMGTADRLAQGWVAASKRDSFWLARPLRLFSLIRQP